MSNLSNSMDCHPPGSSVHGILQERMLEWVAMPFSGISSQLRDWIGIPCTTGRFFTHWTTWDAPKDIPNFLTNRGLCGQGMLAVKPGYKKKYCLPFQFYKGQAIRHCCYPQCCALREIHDGKKNNVFSASDASHEIVKTHIEGIISMSPNSCIFP